MDYNTGQFGTIEEAVNSILSREQDIAGINKPRYMEVAKEVFSDLNLSAIKHTERVLFTIDPRTRSIALPDNFYKFSTISGITPRGQIEPLCYNSNIQDDIVDMGLDDICDAECGCTDALCTYSRHYEIITEEVEALMPDDTYKTFTKTIRKYINKDGSVYVETIEPVAQYDQGVHTATTLQTTSKFLCKLEVKPCGCVIDNPTNRTVWTEKANSIIPGYSSDMLCEWGCPAPGYFPHSATYNFSNDGKRIIFPHDFYFKKVLIRFYAFQKTKDILVPRIAKKALMAGIKYEIANYDKKEPLWRINKWLKDYTNATTDLQAKQNALMLNEFYEYYFGRNAQAGIYFDNNRRISDNDGYFYAF